MVRSLVAALLVSIAGHAQGQISPGAAAKAVADAAFAGSKRLHETRVKENKRRLEIDSDYRRRVDGAKAVMSHPSVQQRYALKVQTKVFECLQGDLIQNASNRPIDIADELRKDTELSAYIFSETFAARHLPHDSAKMNESVRLRAEALGNFASMQTINTSIRLLENPDSAPIAVAWAAEYFSADSTESCRQAPLYPWENTTVDVVLGEVRKALKINQNK